MTNSENKYIKMDEYRVSNRKTLTTLVLSRKSGNCLGEIRWYSAWRQYAFFPYHETLFNHECLGYIQNYLLGLMAARKTKKEIAHD